jgi:hypothetical protein
MSKGQIRRGRHRARTARSAAGGTFGFALKGALAQHISTPIGEVDVVIGP